MTAIRLQSNIQAKLPLSAEENWLKTPAEMTELFFDIPEAVRNSARIADECNLQLELGKFTFPEFVVPNGGSSWNFLESLCREGMLRRFPSGSSEAEDRLQREMAVIRRLGFTDYFLVVWDILRHARERGSTGWGEVRRPIASFRTLWKSPTSIPFDITCFLNASSILNANHLPISILILDGSNAIDPRYVYERYGHDRVAMICTYVTFTARLAVREIGKALGIAGDEITSVSSRIPYGAAIEA